MPSTPEPTISNASFTVDQLQLSVCNVRPHTPDASDLEPSILEVGLKEPILVHPVRGNRSRWGVLAGGRRLKAIRALVARGDLPADWPIPCRLHEGYDDTDLELISFVENEPRKDLAPHERYAATKRQVGRGRPVDQLARALGRDTGEVQRWLRLGQLARPIFDALVDGELTDEEARAYAATEDTTLQLAAWNRLREYPADRRRPAGIRAALGFDDAENRRLIAYVGDDAYRAADGAFELDLFAEDAGQRGRVSDPGLLRRLFDQRLAALKADLRRGTGRADLRFVADPPQHPDWRGTDGALRIAVGDPIAMAAAALPAGDVVGHIAVQPDGQVEVSWWWASRKAKHGATKPVRDSVITETVGAPTVPSTPVATSSHDAAVAALRPAAGMSVETAGIYASIRRRVLQAALIDDAERRTDGLAYDLLVWTQLRQLLGRETGLQVGLRGLTILNADSDAARPLLTDTAASRRLSVAIAELQAHPCLDEPDVIEAFVAFYAADDRLKRIAAAVVAGQALERSLDADGRRSPLHDLIAQQTGVGDDEGFRRWWEPTPAFLDLLPARERLAIAEPLVEPPTYAAWYKLKSSELTQRVAELLTGTAAGVRRTMADAAARWVPELMAFRPPPTRRAVADAAEMPEAAE